MKPLKKTSMVLAMVLAATTMSACGTGTESAQTTSTTISPVKSKGLCDLAATKKEKRKCNKIGDKIKDDVNDAVKYVDNYSKDVAKQVTKEYKNASGQVVDALNQVVNYFPTNWPDLTEEVIMDLIAQAQDEILDEFEDISNQVNGAITDVNKSIKSEINKFATITDMPYDQAEKILDGVLSKFNTAGWLNALSFTGGLKWVPKLQLEAEVKEGQWKDYKTSIGFSLDFFGLKKYYVGMGCLAFWKNMAREPQFLLNGGCNNPWGITLSADMLLNYTKKTALQVSGEVEKLGPQILEELKKSVKGDGNNPRDFAPAVLSLPTNILLASATSLTAGLKKGVKDNTKIAIVTPYFKKPIMLDAGMLVPDLAVGVSIMNPTWKDTGKFNVRMALYILNLTAASLDFGCVQMGTNWNATPTFTFNGGCDNVWDMGGPEDPFTGKQL
jgi:gas vesicle protein